MMWFGLYSRNKNKMDSSGFEHIFAGSDKADFLQTPQMVCFVIIKKHILY